MQLFDLLDDINQQLTEAVTQQMQETALEPLGLDPRSAYRVWVSEDTIAVRKTDDSRMQYYGGFEYVDRECRREFGDWVFYSAEDSRVQDHLDRFYDRESEEEMS